jgi:type II secretory pathway pseudopilin PulG
MPNHPPRITARRRPRAFSVVELLVVIGLVGILITISFVVIAKARRSAGMARVKSDFIAVSTAIDQFKADHKGLPGMVPNVPPGMVFNPSASSSSPDYWHNALAYCLMAPMDQDVDGADGPGFRTERARDNSPRSTPATKLWSPYLSADKFKVQLNPTLRVGVQFKRGYELLDTYGSPIIYLPRRKPGISAAARASGAPAGILADNNRPGAYDARDVAGALTKPPLSGEGRTGLLMALGDLNGSNVIDAGESSAFQGDYILLSAGPDGEYFMTAGATPTDKERSDFQKADDAYNFDR